MNKQLQKHIGTKHQVQEETCKYKCDSCEYKAMFIGELWQHMFKKHPGVDKEFSPRGVKDSILNLLAEQNMDLMEELNALKKDLKDSFEQFNENFMKMKEESDRKESDDKQAFQALTTKVNHLENNTKSAFMELSKKMNTLQAKPTGPIEEPSQSSPSVQGTNPPGVQSPPGSSPPQVPAGPPPPKNANKRRKSKYQLKPKVLLVTDSLGRDIEYNKIERSENIRIRTVKAYSSVENKSARWPQLNVMDMVQQEVSNTPHGDGYDYLILSAPTVDITNVDTTNFSPSESTTEIKQEVIVSCQNMMEVAENALKKNIRLKKVILMSHPPRFDTADVDPMSLKQAMAKFANRTILQLWLDSPLKHKIFIGEHRLECSIETLKLRYTDDKNGRYDGVHMYGNAGKKAYSNSVLTILKDALSTPHPPHQGTPTPAPLPSQDNDFHLHCPQAQYANGLKTKRGGFPKYHQSVKDTNRFRVFSNQGNA